MSEEQDEHSDSDDDEPMDSDEDEVVKSDKAETAEFDEEMFPVLGSAVADTIDQRKDHLNVQEASKWYSESVPVSNSITADQVPLEKFVDTLDHSVISNFTEMGITHLFPVQSLVIPELIKSFKSRALLPPADLCIATPTGSGKTLCYVVPIVQTLMKRVVPRIRAIVLVPTSQLGQQVFEVFLSFTKNTKLKVQFLRGTVNAFRERVTFSNRGCAFMADIIVSTPSYLRSHIKGCSERAFDLRHLRYLVIDEADRVLSVCDPDWIEILENAVFRQERVRDPDWYSSASKGWSVRLPPLIVNRQRLGCRSVSNLQAVGRLPLQKVLLSATLNLDPDVLKHLNLYRLKMYSVGSSSVDNQGAAVLVEHKRLPMVSLPEGLDERYLVCGAQEKPLVIYSLLKRFPWSRIFCFTETLEHSRRLAALLTLMKLDNVEELSGSLMHYRRTKVIKDFQSGKVSRERVT
ncbi:unnamed protein product [Soboliphyme baturini]|uniref:ATP-dependent RNA helicase n=1 Tax=Soboliphyme baturini TaxID=241478 RepID=A0A183IVN4_9BILA|nr:unnamed protein product [Soboliphyme baturini]